MLGMIGFAVLFATAVAAGRPWAPALGPLYNVVMMVLDGGPHHALDALSRPQEVTFIPVLLSMVLAGIAAGAGSIALAQNYGKLRRTPVWFGTVLVSTAALCLGAVTVSTIPVDGGSFAVQL